jgi:hypothetical protein
MKTLASVLMIMAWPLVVCAELPPGMGDGVVFSDCGDQVCVIPKRHLDALIAANRKMEEALRKEPPKCATLEVEPKKDEKPRTPPLPKKERDT